jgi:predicted SAM-dependent methyltransferase
MNKENTVSRKLHIGGRIPHSEWEILDALPGPHVDHLGDARDLSRFADGTFDAVYASHVLEHFDYAGALPDALREWRRVLVPGGRLYISVPNLEVLAAFVVDRDTLSFDERFHVMRMIFGGHTTAYDFHYVGLDIDFLEHFLGQAGFSSGELVQDFGLFDDTSRLRFKGVPISLNVVAVN